MMLRRNIGYLVLSPGLERPLRADEPVVLESAMRGCLLELPCLL